MPEYKIRIFLETPPTGVLFGIQSGNGSNYDVLQKQRSSGVDLVFETVFTVKPSKSAKSGIDYAGKTIQGKVNERFLYINIGSSAGDFTSPWSRRLKIPMIGIDQY